MSWQILRPLLEKLDGTLVIIDLANGETYSVTGAGIELWQGIRSNQGKEALVDLLRATYCLDNHSPREVVDDFIDALVDANLIKPQLNNTQAVPIPVPVANQSLKTFNHPRIEKGICPADEHEALVKQSRWAVSGPNIASPKMGDHGSAIDKTAKVVYRMTGLGATMWSCLTRGYSRTEILDCLGQSDLFAPDMVASQLDLFVRQLLELNLIHPNNQTVPSVPLNLPQKLSTAPIRILAYKNFDMVEACSFIARYEPRTSEPSAGFDGELTIGIGFNLLRPDARKIIENLSLDFDEVRSGRVRLSDIQVNKLLYDDVQFAFSEAEHLVPDFLELPSDVRVAIVAAIFKLGPVRFSCMEEAIQYILDGDFETAGDLIENSPSYPKMGELGSETVALLKGVYKRF